MYQGTRDAHLARVELMSRGSEGGGVWVPRDQGQLHRVCMQGKVKTWHAAEWRLLVRGRTDTRYEIKPGSSDAPRSYEMFVQDKRPISGEI
jgi:hypothetical protein